VPHLRPARIGHRGKGFGHRGRHSLISTAAMPGAGWADAAGGGVEHRRYVQRRVQPGKGTHERAQVSDRPWPRPQQVDMAAPGWGYVCEDAASTAVDKTGERRRVPVHLFAATAGDVEVSDQAPRGGVV